ncbi:MAG: glycoside hydrolase family 108 protein, partial [Bdellovibrionales bacterium]
MFRQAVENVLKVEGGYTNHPDDRGGPTNFGITLQTLSQYRGTPVSDEDVRNLTRDEAIDIYYKFYWLPLGLDKVTKTKLAALIFDQGVNKGIYSAAKTIQKAVGVAADGKIGPMTLSAINACDET